MLLPSSVLRTARRLNKLLWKKLVGKPSKRFSSGRSIWAWHSGQRNFPSLWLALAWFSRHWQQNVCRHDIVLGWLKVSRQIEHSRCFLRSFKRDSIASRRLLSETYETHPHQGFILISEKTELGINVITVRFLEPIKWHKISCVWLSSLGYMSDMQIGQEFVDLVHVVQWIFLVLNVQIAKCITLWLAKWCKIHKVYIH